MASLSLNNRISSSTSMEEKEANIDCSHSAEVHKAGSLWKRERVKTVSQAARVIAIHCTHSLCWWWWWWCRWWCCWWWSPWWCWCWWWQCPGNWVIKSGRKQLAFSATQSPPRWSWSASSLWWWTSCSLLRMMWSMIMIMMNTCIHVECGIFVLTAN